jgi:chromosome segregation protein
MTARREVPFTGDTLAWVHNELAEIKSRLSLVQQAADQGRAVAADASEKALQSRQKVDQFEAQATALIHLQDEIHVVREQLVRMQDDIHSLRQSREEVERRVVADAERSRQERNEIARRFGEVERQVEAWQERLASVEEHNRRNLEMAAQLVTRFDALEGEHSELDTLQSRSQATISRMDQELLRISGSMASLEREDDVQRERSNTAIEMLRRLETDIDALKAETNRISRIDDRVELVQAERTRHNDRLNEITADMEKIDDRLHAQAERIALLDVRMGGYQEEMRHLKEMLAQDREQISSYVTGLRELESDIRKRQIIALEKEIRDIRGRALDFADE